MSESTGCCVVGAGPAGAMLALLLARKGVSVTLLEAHKDFDREFRGDTLHSSTLEILESIGLADRVLELPHTRMTRLTLMTPNGEFTPVDLSRLPTKFNFVTLMPQSRFLEFLTNEARQFPNFRLVMGANVDELLIEQDAGANVVRGVRFQQNGQPCELRATVTIACDGRSSRIRKESGLSQQLKKTSPPMDVLWFRLSRRPGDPESLTGRIRDGHLLVVLPRVDHFQIGYVIVKGSFRDIREAGLDRFRESVAVLSPVFADRIGELQSWQAVTPLSVESSRLERWYRPGLLLIGDAAHVMSPIGGVGINCAIQDAVITANLLHRSLLSGSVSEQQFAAVQRQREWPTRIVQWMQARIQDMVIRQALDDRVQFRLPWVLRLPGLRTLPARIFGFGPRRVRVE